MKNQFRSTWRLPVKGLRLTEGSSWLHQRSRQDLPDLPAIPRAIRLQFLAPNLLTSRLRMASSSGDQGPLTRSPLAAWLLLPLPLPFPSPSPTTIASPGLPPSAPSPSTTVISSIFSLPWAPSCLTAMCFTPGHLSFFVGLVFRDFCRFYISGFFSNYSRVLSFIYIYALLASFNPPRPPGCIGYFRSLFSAKSCLRLNLSSQQ